MPPGCVPSRWWTSKKPSTSSMMRSKWRVLWPLGDSSVLPCIGSHCQTTRSPAAGGPAAGGGGGGGGAAGAALFPHPGHERDAAVDAVGSEPVDECDGLLGRRARADLH